MEVIFSYINHFTRLSSEGSDELSKLFQLRIYKKGELFIDEGKIAQQIGFLESGVIRGFYRNEEGTEYNKHFFVAPCFCGGYSSLVSGMPNQIIQEVLVESKVWIADYSKFTALYEKFPKFERLSRILAEQFFVQKEQREIELVLLNADKRYEIFKRDFPQLEQLIPQYHIASYLGITPIQLSRIRRKLASE